MEGKNFTIKSRHRNSQKRFYDPGYIYFITTVTADRFPFFENDLLCELFIENLRICKAIKKFKLYAFTILPDHVHLLIKANERFNISKIMQFLKRHFSRDVNYILSSNNEGEIRESRLQCGNYEFNTEIINAHDKQLIWTKNEFIKKYGHSQHEVPSFQWKQSFHDHVIRNEKDFFKHVNYIANNCIKHKVCENEEKYRWSFLNEEWKNVIDDF